MTRDLWARGRAFLEEGLWTSAPPGPAPLRWAQRAVQLAVVIGQGFVRDQLLLRAYALTYLTVLSIVPLLAIAVTLADLVGVSDRVLEVIVDQLAAAVPEAGEYLVEFAERLDFGALGPIMGGVLIGATILTIGGIEQAFNAIWGVRQQRPWVRRVPDYLAVLLVAPLLLGVAIPLRASLETQWVIQRFLELPGFQPVYDLGLRYAPTLLVTVAFSLLYWFLPNTDVRMRSALLGGVVAALLFGVAQRLYLMLNVGAAKYNAIFGTFAFVPLFMVWVYTSWSIILLGAEVAYSNQTLGRYLREVRGAPAGPAARESIGLAIALEAARAFREAGPPWTTEALSEALDVPLRTVRDVVDALERAGVVRACAGGDREGEGGYQLARPAESIRVVDVLVALRGPREANIQRTEVAGAVADTFVAIDRAIAEGEGARSLDALLDRLERAPAAVAAAPSPGRPAAAVREAT